MTAWDWGEGKWVDGRLLNAYGVPAWDEDNVLELDSGNDCPSL